MLFRSCLVELGAGTGPVTAELMRRSMPDCKVVVVERDPDFCRRLRQRFPDADIVQADALDFEKLLRDRGIEEADHVISGLPLPSFPAEDRDRLLHAVGRRLAKDGTFRQITAMPWVYRRLYRTYFEEVKFRLVPLNLPPGGVYVCRRMKLRGGGEVQCNAMNLAG